LFAGVFQKERGTAEVGRTGINYSERGEPLKLWVLKERELTGNGVAGTEKREIH
jgi:hypothetical protein